MTALAVASLTAENTTLRDRIAELEAENAQLRIGAGFREKPGRPITNHSPEAAAQRARQAKYRAKKAGKA